MKWKNKGHEFDIVYENISQKKAFYLFGLVVLPLVTAFGS